MDNVKLLYELYKLDWIRNHISYKELMQSLSEYNKEKYINYSGDDRYTFEDWLFDNCGFPCGQMYACIDEFIENEYRDAEYVRGLLE
jgi:hypothetical protein